MSNSSTAFDAELTMGFRTSPEMGSIADEDQTAHRHMGWVTAMLCIRAENRGKPLEGPPSYQRKSEDSIRSVPGFMGFRINPINAIPKASREETL